MDDSIADYTRELARRIDSLPDEIKALFTNKKEFAERVAWVDEWASTLEFDFLHVFSWLERNRSVPLAHTWRMARIANVIGLARGVSQSNSPEFLMNGPIDPARISIGFKYFLELVGVTKILANELHKLADDMESADDPDQVILDKLSQWQRDALRFLLKAEATSAETSQSRRNIAVAIVGEFVDHENYTSSLTRLRDLKLIKSKRGPEGGYYLTPKGLRVATRL